LELAFLASAARRTTQSPGLPASDHEHRVWCSSPRSPRQCDPHHHANEPLGVLLRPL